MRIFWAYFVIFSVLWSIFLPLTAICEKHNSAVCELMSTFAALPIPARRFEPYLGLSRKLMIWMERRWHVQITSAHVRLRWKLTLHRCSIPRWVPCAQRVGDESERWIGPKMLNLYNVHGVGVVVERTDLTPRLEHLEMFAYLRARTER